MKLFYLLFTTFFFLLSKHFIQAQTPDYLANGSKWRINWMGISMTAPCWITKKYVVEINGDTIIGQYTYKKMIHHGLNDEQQQPSPNPSSPPCNPTFTFSGPYAYLRQDSLKIYIREIYEDTDSLLYDFDLQIGDTLPLSFNNSLSDITVTGITTLQVGNENRKVFQLSTNGQPIEKLIEGIGHNLGFIGTMQPFEFSETELVCFSRNDTTYYTSPSGICDLNVGIEEPSIVNEFLVFPNPVNSSLIIETALPLGIRAIYALDLFGKKTPLNFEVLNEKQFKINSEKLNKGIYFLQFIDFNSQVYTYKIVKE